jgi:hypothetical protein
LVKPGSTLTTVAPTKTILARAKIGNTFDSQFAIYNIGTFLSSLSLFNDPTLEIHEKFVSIVDGKKKLNYTFADASTIITPPEKDINFPDPEINFRLSEENFKDVMKAISVLGAEELFIVGDGKTISVQAGTNKNPSACLYSLEVADTDKTFRAIFSVDNLKIISGDYNVSLSSKKISKFSSDELEYFIALAPASTFSL